MTKLVKNAKYGKMIEGGAKIDEAILIVKVTIQTQYRH